jgi:hypothetical protein
LDSEIERGEEEEATEAYILVRRGDDDEINKVIGSFLNKVHQSFYLIGIYGSKEKALVTMKTGIFLVRQPQRPGSNRCTYRVSKNS